MRPDHLPYFYYHPYTVWTDGQRNLFSEEACTSVFLCTYVCVSNCLLFFLCFVSVFSGFVYMSVFLFVLMIVYLFLCVCISVLDYFR